MKEDSRLKDASAPKAAGVASAPSSSSPAAAPEHVPVNTDGRTKAEKAFEEAQRKREAQMIEKRIAKSHRQKIEV